MYVFTSPLLETITTRYYIEDTLGERVHLYKYVHSDEVYQNEWNKKEESFASLLSGNYRTAAERRGEKGDWIVLLMPHERRGGNVHNTVWQRQEIPFLPISASSARVHI